MMFRRLCAAAWAAAALAVLSPTSMARAQTTIVFNSFLPPNFVVNQGIVKPWIAEVERVTEGRVRFNVPGATLGPPPEQMNMVRQGVVDGAYIFHAFLRNSHPLVQISLLPLTGKSAQAEAVAMWRTYKKFFEKKGEYSDVILLGFFAGPPGHLFSMDEPITTADQLKNMKVYSLPGYPAQAIGSLGAAVVPGPAARCYEIISKGTVEAFAGLNYGDTVGFKVDQFAKSVTQIEGGVFAPAFSVFISKAKWNQISPADRAKIMEVSGESLARHSRAWDEFEAKSRQSYISRGVRIEPVPAEMKRVLKKKWSKIHEEWIGQANKLGVDGRAALDFYNAEVKKFAAGN